jgi:VanZ family protein
MIRNGKLTLLLVVAAALLSTFSLLDPPQSSTFWNSLFDTGHGIVFACFALVAFAFLRTFRPSHRTTTHLGAAFAVSVAAGLSIEVVQYFGPRDADAGDVVRNVLGTAGALSVLAAFRPGWNRWRRAGALALAFALLLGASSPLVLLAAAYAQRDASFPRICDFDSPWEKLLYTAAEASLTVESPPASWKRAPGDRAARVTFHAGGFYPRLHLRDVYPDWTGYRALVFDVYSLMPDTTMIYIRVQDRHFNHDWRDRFMQGVAMGPGSGTVRIPLAAVVDGPRGRKLDLTAVDSIGLFVDHPEEPVSFHVDAFRLE